MNTKNSFIELFRDIEIDDLLKQYERRIKNILHRKPVISLNYIDLDSEINAVISELHLDIPRLDKDKISSKLININIPSLQNQNFYNGIFHNNIMINYFIPFLGNYEFFKCLPHSYPQETVTARLNPNYLVIQPKEQQRETQNNNNLDEVLNFIEIIEQNLSSISQDVNNYYIPKLKNKLKIYYVWKY